MNFQNLNDIIDTALSWFFNPTLLSTPTMAFFVDLAKIILGFMAIYFIGIFPFVISFKCIINDWRIRK